MQNLTKEQEFGPYSDFPQIYIDYSEEQSLIRTIFEEETEINQPQTNKKTRRQKIWDYLFEDNPPKPSKTKERKFLRKETLAKKINGFKIIEKENKYYIRAILS